MLIALQVLRRAASDDTEPTLLDIYTSTKAILFLGTPHRGSGKAEIAEVVRRIISATGFDTTDQNIRALQVSSLELELFHELFMNLYNRKYRQFKVLTFQEAKGVAGINYLKLNERVGFYEKVYLICLLIIYHFVQVVEPFSSSFTGNEPVQIINANHMTMCQFTGKDDEGYRQISGEIKIIISELQHRKEQDKLEKISEREIMKSRAGSPSQTTTASVAYCR